MNIIYLNHGLINEDESDHCMRSREHFCLSSVHHCKITFVFILDAEAYHFTPKRKVSR